MAKRRIFELMTTDNIELLAAWHLSVQKHTPELRQWQARLHQLDDAAKPSGEPGGSASGDLLWLIGGAFFVRGGGVEGGPPSPGDPPGEGQGPHEGPGVAAGGGGGVGGSPSPTPR